MAHRSPSIILLVAVASGFVVWRALRRPERVLYVGGPILTMDAADRVVEALLTEGDRIQLDPATGEHKCTHVAPAEAGDY